MPWLGLLFYFILFFLVIYIFDRMMIKVLQIPRKSVLFDNHVNTTHRKVDWILRIIFILMIIVGEIINTLREPLPAIFILEPFTLVFLLIYVTELWKAYVEWKYEREKNSYKLTLYRLLVVTIFLGFILTKIGFIN